jgi:hypothetical protein
MSLDFVAEVWDALRGHIDLNDRSDAADTLVNLLIENNHEADEIKDAFRGDKDISTALKYYAQQHDYQEDYEEEDYEEDYEDQEED